MTVALWQKITVKIARFRIAHWGGQIWVCQDCQPQLLCFNVLDIGPE